MLKGKPIYFYIINIFAIIFIVLGLHTYINSKQGYTFNGEYHFNYEQTTSSTRTVKTGKYRRTKVTEYAVVYSGLVENQNLKYEVENFSSSAKAHQYRHANPVETVHVYVDGDDFLIIDNDQTIEDYQGNQKWMSIIFMNIGFIVLFIGYKMNSSNRKWL